MPDDTDDVLALADESLESLSRRDVVVPAMDMEVSTVSRTESTVGRSPAAVFVLTNEMIRRSGARSIPEALRLVPGVNVARASSNTWAISIRGFNDLFSNKLLVQIDGRTVYTPVFSGVFWDQQDVLLEDVERIEVIRGPGATVWGANAVNGVINILTKRARDTQGAFVQGGGGTHQRGFGGFRYGGSLDESSHYRVYGKGFDRDRGFHDHAEDDWRKGQIGFRADWEPSECTTVTLQGDYYEGKSGQCVDDLLASPPFVQAHAAGGDEKISGSDILLRLSRTLDEESDWAVQLYYDRAARLADSVNYFQSTDTFDLDFQHRFPVGSRQSLIWGCGYRNTRNVTDGNFIISFDPAVRSFGLISYFVQDQITLSEDLLYFTVGSKFEHNQFSGFEYQPSARLMWTPSQRQTAWAAISRAVRTPSRTDQDIRVLGGPVALSFAPPGVTFLQFVGSPDAGSEELLAYEAGFRTQPTDAFWWDLAVFYNQYDNLIFRTPGAPFPPAAALPPAYWQMIYTNGTRAETYGIELAATYQVNPCWKLQGGYTFLKMFLHAPPTAASGAEDDEGESPQNQVYLQSGWDLGCDWQLDVIGRYVDSLPDLDIPSYVVMDVRLAWMPTENMEVAAVGRHMLEGIHPEFSTRRFNPTEVRQEVYGMVTWRY